MTLLDTTRFGAARLAGFKNSAVKRDGAGVVPEWVTSWEVLTWSPETNREVETLRGAKADNIMSR